ncbi:hypothetical protein C3L33_10161, partial [Rhododendron williamsianum]
MELQLIRNLGEGYSRNQKAAQAYIRGVAPSQVQSNCREVEHPDCQRNASTGLENFGVKRLVVIETEEMYKARKQEGAKHLALRSPLVVTHLPASASNSSE